MTHADCDAVLCRSRRFVTRPNPGFGATAQSQVSHFFAPLRYPDTTVPLLGTDWVRDGKHEVSVGKKRSGVSLVSELLKMKKMRMVLAPIQACTHDGS